MTWNEAIAACAVAREFGYHAELRVDPALPKTAPMVVYIPEEGQQYDDWSSFQRFLEPRAPSAIPAIIQIQWGGTLNTSAQGVSEV